MTMEHPVPYDYGAPCNPFTIHSHMGGWWVDAVLGRSYNITSAFLRSVDQFVLRKGLDIKYVNGGKINVIF